MKNANIRLISSIDQQQLFNTHARDIFSKVNPNASLVLPIDWDSYDIDVGEVHLNTRFN